MSGLRGLSTKKHSKGAKCKMDGYSPCFFLTSLDVSDAIYLASWQKHPPLPLLSPPPSCSYRTRLIYAGAFDTNDRKYLKLLYISWSCSANCSRIWLWYLKTSEQEPNFKGSFRQSELWLWTVIVEPEPPLLTDAGAAPKCQFGFCWISNKFF